MVLGKFIQEKIFPFKLNIHPCKVEPLSAIHYLVVGAGGDMHELMESIRKIKEKVPRLKVNPSLTI